MWKLSLRELLMAITLICVVTAFVIDHSILSHRLAIMKLETTCEFHNWRADQLEHLLYEKCGITVKTVATGLFVDYGNGTGAWMPTPEHDGAISPKYSGSYKSWRVKEIGED